MNIPTRQTTAPPSPPEVRTWELASRNNGPRFNIQGRLLGFASSEVAQHDHLSEFTPAGKRCSACRWFEVRIFEVESLINEFKDLESPEARFLVHTTGRTEIPGETDRIRAYWTDSGFEVTECLTVRKPNDTFITGPSARALAQASQFNQDIADGYVNRAVA
jgi:hypothetical protein